MNQFYLRKKPTLFFVLLFALNSLFSQGQNCGSIIYDSGGASGNYGNGESISTTVYPDTTNEAVRFTFLDFNIENGWDFFVVYDGPSIADSLIGVFTGNVLPGSITSTHPTGALTFVFESDFIVNLSGYEILVSCVTPCQTITAQLDTASPAPNSDGTILVCQGDEITLNGSGQFSQTNGGQNATYQWELSDGTIYNGQSATFSLNEPGVYLANLKITDENTEIFDGGCTNDNLINQVIWVSTTTDISFIESTPSQLCYGDVMTITPVVTPETFTYECTPPESNTTFLPDGDGASYSTCITVDCFDSDQTLEDVSQIIDICLNIEHSYLGDLDIIIISPDGRQSYLHEYPQGSGIFLGAPIDNDNDLTPGVGADYCFSTSETTNLADGPTMMAGTPPRPSIIPGIYMPNESFNQLVGSPLNGTWCINIVDNIPSDNGYIFSWGINFDPTLIPNSRSFTPEIISGAWSDAPTITNINGNIITISPDSEGQYCYTYNVLDNFGCQYSEEICIDLLPELIFDEPNDLFICDSGSLPNLFDLLQNETVILAPTPNPTNYVISFHNSQLEAENDTNPISNLSNYQGFNQEVIFVRFEYLDSSCFEIESFELILSSILPPSTGGDIIECDSGQTITATATVPAGQSITWYDSDTAGNVVADPSLNGAGNTIYYAEANDDITGCVSATRTRIVLVIESLPDLPISSGDVIECDSGQTLRAVATVLAGQSITWYDSDTAGNVVLDPSLTGVGTVIYYAESTDNLTGCKSTIRTPVILDLDIIPFVSPLDPFEICDNDSDGIETFNLTDIEPSILNGQLGISVTYHLTQSDADTGLNALNPNFTNSAANTQTIYVRLTNDLTGCFTTTPLDLVVYALPFFDLDDNYLICIDSSGIAANSIEVDSGLSNSNYNFSWIDDVGSVISIDPILTINQGGNYSLVVSYIGTSCSYQSEVFNVSESSPPVMIAEVASEPFVNTHIIVATATGTGIYEFSLDQGPWQDSGNFIGVSPGSHTVNVRDVNGCGQSSYELIVIDYPPYFTPNGDGYNDFWNVDALSTQPTSKIYIFDRFGKLLKQIRPAGPGWDGTYNGNNMPTNDYWFLLEYTDISNGQPKQHRGHFTLKR